MKKCILLFSFLLFNTVFLWGQMYEESMKVLYKVDDVKRPYLIKPDHSIEQDVTFETKSYPVRRTLRVVGGIKMSGKFEPRGEEFFRQAEFLIDDYLDSVNVKRDRYSLYFEGKNDPFERHVYNRFLGSLLKPGTFTVEMNVKQQGLQISKDGDFGVELQVYYKNPRRNINDVYDKADTVLYMPVPAGKKGFNLLKKDFVLPNNVASILVRVGGTKFSGACWVEAPRIVQSGKTVCEFPFVSYEKRDNDFNYWVGVNMVSRSWPKWRLDFNGETIYRGNIFDRASDIADFYIPLPNDLSGKGKFKLTLEKEAYRAPFSYELQSLQLIEETARDFEIVSIPKFVSVGDTTGILIETNQPNQALQVSGDGAIVFAQTTFQFANTGLHVIPFVAKEAKANVLVRISNGKDTREGHIGQLIIKDRDNVYLSSGEEIYIDKVFEPYDYFFKWYIRERVGNWYHFRPSYQWSGVRITDANVIKHYTKLLNQMGMPYAWQVEGRTLAATKINPSLADLKSPMFRGKQAHENDGGYYYWQHFLYKGLHSDMAARTRPYGGIFAKHRPIFTDKGVFIHYDPYGVKDMADGANKLVANLSYSRGESTRHTGPSTLFKYLYQAGYDWLGAEQMYGPEDVIMSSLRGASKAYGKKEFGSLHAVQWGSFPFTDPKHAHRFYMSLAVAYMHGSSHINTEEGLWTDEYANDRYTEAGKQHIYAQRQLLDYIETHSRKGSLTTPIAVIQGRNDGWKSFGRTSLWSQKEDKWKFNKAQESFDLLKVFYPNSIIDGCGPEGWFTNTPYGAVDILPIEASVDVMNQYKALIFLGWNSFDNTDFIRIRKFVEQGGTVLLTAAHLNSNLQPDTKPYFPADETVIQGFLGLDYKAYTSKKEISLGKGRVIYYPQNCYPAESEIREAYTQSMKELADRLVAKEALSGWLASSPYIDFSVWDEGDLRTIYALNVDWDKVQGARAAKLLLNGKEFNFDVDMYKLATIRVKSKLGAMPLANTSDVLDIKDMGDKWIITFQTTGADNIYIFDGLKGVRKTMSVNDSGIHQLEYLKN